MSLGNYTVLYIKMKNSLVDMREGGLGLALNRNTAHRPQSYNKSKNFDISHKHCIVSTNLKDQVCILVKFC